ncbi:hypothetical protein CDD81_5988 [Ophiocordyceps australis]|uniref:DUF3955 domain-containing protein n=1 Tax=Ophiocordyceps australis TaxID=1399860 RepID=A0A2C5Y3V5_9HYPO|nr:hypothetical protein CDD81_5988 [Ophiocordyceps australis]
MKSPESQRSSDAADPRQRSAPAMHLDAASQSAMSLPSMPSSCSASSPGPFDKGNLAARLGLTRRALGICLLLVTVCLWTVSNFLASFIFSDHTYNKPFFLVYINTSVFAFSLLPLFVKYLLNNGLRGLRSDVVHLWRDYKYNPSHMRLPASQSIQHVGPVDDDDDAMAPPSERLMVDDADSVACVLPEPRLGLAETAVLSLEFSMLWFLANYFASACLEHTSVASVTILTSTSSVWTLVFCSLFRVESFSLRKFLGVLASLAGVVFISTVDLTGESDENRGSFPHKTSGQIALGDSMALFSAVIYGLYVTVMKRRVGNEDKVDMRLFFGLVGVFNLALLWPLFFILHWTGIEPFEMPPTGKIWTIIIVNSLSSFMSDMSWAFSMLLTTPLVVTVGLSLSIPLSLVGEMIQYGQYSSFMYWIGATIVFVSFLFVNNESHDECHEHRPARDEGPERIQTSAAAIV